MSDQHNGKAVEDVISDIIEHGENHAQFYYHHGDCPGIALGNYEEREELYSSPCSVLDCEEPGSNVPLDIAGQSAPFGLCVDHFWYWLENKAEVTCEECAAWFEALEVSE